MDKLVVILGPTASGKSALAIKLARLFNGEIISADSRQVYRGLDIGSGKITKREMAGIPHHLLDVANPTRKFTVAQYQKLARRTILQIQKRGRLPFLVGGTGFYIQSIVDGIVIPEVKPNWKLRKKLERKTIKELYQMLLKLDPARAANIDPQNPRRLIRAIEIVKTTGKPVPPAGGRPTSTVDVGRPLLIGIKKSPQELKKLIAARLKKRIKGIIIEVKNLHLPVGRQAKTGLSFKRLEELGLEYRFVAQYLQQKISYGEMIDAIQKESLQFTKRQMTWFKRDQRIHWVKNQTEAQKLIKNFLH
ncbi:MAG: tRNA (adenosine(37)-N6)-dimethylallyltransferase MiaA [Candidatus Staskawiczbacteria bacterium RIFCSPHIGHO2_02_FULL_43_16]|uniref:tRNA dimethylallyltransferase n=1 Tax=Candidatus Staskawiczbacteria bacterium RIFCSPHIGHO2_01_FULL_41_41 TaxID=1802203 RepID=A0A1G2HVD1_9BACT|nr:MAG: tRNA (adenosine(37)-N6)-dimethylallyltransferase MiaA [Candidatus Staskawiczbacteria bacterium RIFCSPHIGHO2_01_FULL_41_41]OGZ69100.1 MAG: tRNA (adenosine(37)-N6)-dimethylallyltransferase MiaA [Candidatus Staskawiczbacteria bacterium RIFCSPHIGHO2_02_FULL_43_16]